MSIGFRCILIVISILTMFYILKKIRESKLEIGHAIFWIGFSVLIIILSLIPQSVYWLTDFLGIQSPVNFVYLVILFVLIMKNFMLTLQLSNNEHKLQALIQQIALKEKDNLDECDK